MRPRPANRLKIIRRTIETIPTDYSRLDKWSEKFEYPATEADLDFFSARPINLDRVKIKCGTQYREYEFEGAEVQGNRVTLFFGDQIKKMI